MTCMKAVFTTLFNEGQGLENSFPAIILRNNLQNMYVFVSVLGMHEPGTY